MEGFQLEGFQPTKRKGGDSWRSQEIGVMKLGTEQQAGAEEYAAYLQSPVGKIRTDLSWANLYGFLPPPVSEPCALDLGGGTGAISVRTCRIGVPCNPGGHLRGDAYGSGTRNP